MKVNPLTWQRYKNVINEFNDDANQMPILWHKYMGGLDRFGEDNLDASFTDIEIKGLIQYNYFRSWPMTKTTVTGELDGENCVVFFNLEYLRLLGHIDPVTNYFIFDRAADRFVIEGIRYKASGDTPVSQASDEPLHIILVLQREDLKT